MLHGIDTKREKQKQTLQDAQTNIICVLGTAPTFVLDEENKTLNTPVPVRNYTDLAKYAGDNYRNYTIYDAIDTIFQESDGATVYIINVFDETKHKTTVENEQHTPIANKFNISHIGLSNLKIKVGDETGTEGEDYEVTTNADDCTITLKSEAFKNAQASTILCSYDYADTTKVTAADFVGSVDADGNKTGAKAITNVTQIWGDDVNIIIAPEFSAQSAVRDAIINVADDIKARTYLDAPKNTRVNAAIQGRKNNQNVDLICSDENAYMALPWVKRYNQFLDETLIKPISPVLAGIRVRLNKEQDIAKSIDNTESRTIKGLEFPVEFISNKENTESNALNAVGIGTVINWNGTFRVYGSRNCAYPSKSGIETFDSVIDTANFIEKTIENGSFECVGAKVTRAFIDNVLESIKAKFNTWKNPEVGLILDGDVWYDEQLNDAESVANGYIRFNYDFCPPSVAEHIRFSSFINIKYITTALSA
ncbi:phage tail sheath subtilisin-like domain-containing protein [bacterium]|nr:phage tail sheath subtilisin-like domain-containing protein [bacterium]